MRRSASSGGTPRRGEVVELVVVDRADRARVRALHVVGLDLEVGHRLRLGAFGEHEVAVGLERPRAADASGRMRIRPGVDRLRGVFDRTLEQEVAARVRRGVVLQRAEVEHLVPVAEVDRGEVALRRRRRRAATRCAAGRTDRRARPPTTAGSRHDRGAHAGARPATCAGRAPAPTRTARGRCRRRAARRPRRRSGRCVRGAGVGRRAEAVEHGDLGAVPGDHEGVREAGEAVALRPVQHDDRAARRPRRAGTFTNAPPARKASCSTVNASGDASEHVPSSVRDRRRASHVASPQTRTPLASSVGVERVVHDAPVAHDDEPGSARPPPRRPDRRRVPARRPARPAARRAPGGTGRGRARRCGCSARSPRRRWASSTSASSSRRRDAPRDEPVAARGVLALAFDA